MAWGTYLVCPFQSVGGFFSLFPCTIQKQMKRDYLWHFSCRGFSDCVLKGGMGLAAWSWPGGPRCDVRPQEGFRGLVPFQRVPTSGACSSIWQLRATWPLLQPNFEECPISSKTAPHPEGEARGPLPFRALQSTPHHLRICVAPRGCWSPPGRRAKGGGKRSLPSASQGPCCLVRADHCSTYVVSFALHISLKMVLFSTSFS